MRKQRHRSAAQLISALVFIAQIVKSLFFLYTKFQASSHLLWLYSPVCVGPGRKPRSPVFSQRGSFETVVAEYKILDRWLCFSVVPRMRETLHLELHWSYSVSAVWLYPQFFKQMLFETFLSQHIARLRKALSSVNPLHCEQSHGNQLLNSHILFSLSFRNIQSEDSEL